MWKLIDIYEEFLLPIISCLREPWRLVCRLLMTCSWSAGMRSICIYRSYCYVATFYYVPYLLKCKARVFPEIWRLNMWDCLKFSYNVPNPTMLSQTKACIIKSHVRSALLCCGILHSREGNPTMLSQTKACIIKSNVRSALLCCGILHSREGNSTPTFWDNLWAPYSKV